MAMCITFTKRETLSTLLFALQSFGHLFTSRVEIYTDYYHMNLSGPLCLVFPKCNTILKYRQSCAQVWWLWSGLYTCPTRTSAFDPHNQNLLGLKVSPDTGVLWGVAQGQVWGRGAVTCEGQLGDMSSLTVRHTGMHPLFGKTLYNLHSEIAIPLVISQAASSKVHKSQNTSSPHTSFWNSNGIDYCWNSTGHLIFINDAYQFQIISFLFKVILNSYIAPNPTEHAHCKFPFKDLWTSNQISLRPMLLYRTCHISFLGNHAQPKLME